MTSKVLFYETFMLKWNKDTYCKEQENVQEQKSIILKQFLAIQSYYACKYLFAI